MIPSVAKHTHITWPNLNWHCSSVKGSVDNKILWSKVLTGTPRRQLLCWALLCFQRCSGGPPLCTIYSKTSPGTPYPASAPNLRKLQGPLLDPGPNFPHCCFAEGCVVGIVLSRPPLTACFETPCPLLARSSSNAREGGVKAQNIYAWPNLTVQHFPINFCIVPLKSTILQTLKLLVLW